MLVFHAEKNRWGANEYSFHCGVYLRALGAESTPPCHRCPVQVTLDRLAPDAMYIDRISNVEDPSLSTASRIEAIVGAVQAYALPWLQGHATLRGSMELANVDYDELLSRVVVWRAAYDCLATLRRSA